MILEDERQAGDCNTIQENLLSGDSMCAYYPCTGDFTFAENGNKGMDGNAVTLAELFAMAVSSAASLRGYIMVDELA